MKQGNAKAIAQSKQVLWLTNPSHQIIALIINLEYYKLIRFYPTKTKFKVYKEGQPTTDTYISNDFSNNKSYIAYMMNQTLAESNFYQLHKKLNIAFNTERR